MKDTQVIKRSCVPSTLFIYNLPTLIRMYRHKEVALSFLETTLEVLEEYNFLYLEKEVEEKLGDLLNAILLENREEEDLWFLREGILQKRKEAKALTEEEKKKQLAEDIAKEREKRKISEEVPLTKQDIIKFLEEDYHHLIQLNVMDYDLNSMRINLLYYLTTNNRFLEHCPELFSSKEVITYITYLTHECLRLQKYQERFFPYIEEYSQETLKSLQQKEEENFSSKIIPFQKVKTRSRICSEERPG